MDHGDLLSGKVSLVTGAGSGIGAAIGLAFASAGAAVAVTDIDQQAAAAVAKKCRAAGARAVAIALDVSDPSSVAAAFERLGAELSGLDILVNNAGIVHRDPAYIGSIRSTMEAQLAEAMSGNGISTHWRAIEDLSDEMFDRMLKVHLYGTFYCTRAALRLMREGGRGGRIINMGSIMGTTSLNGAPDYCAAKGAILAFTRATAREAASYGVLANAIAPGFIDTPLLDDFGETERSLFCAQTPLGRLGRAEEIAQAALFLAGPQSSFVTGQTISPNGGLYMSQ